MKASIAVALVPLGPHHGDDAAALLPRFASLRRERYAAMRDVFDGLHDELLRIRVAIDAFASV